MNRRLFSLLLPLVPAALAGKRGGVTVKLTGLDPRFVEQQKIAAASRQLTLEQWFVHAAVIMSGYHEEEGEK